MNKLIVVIGAGPGLGFSVAKRFAKEGFESVLVARNESKLREMSDQLSQTGVKSYYKAADVADAKQLSDVLHEIEKEYGTPDCVVYNTGITAPDSDNLSASDLVEHFKVDVAGAYTAVKSVVNENFAAKKGAVIFTGGGLAMYPVDGFLPLSIDKAALRALAYILHNRYEKDGIFVGTVTICGTINGDDYFASDNIAELYWQMFSNRDKCEYAYQYPSLAPDKLYEDQTPAYGLFEENSDKYWGEVYGLMNSQK